MLIIDLVVVAVTFLFWKTEPFRFDGGVVLEVVCCALNNYCQS